MISALGIGISVAAYMPQADEPVGAPNAKEIQLEPRIEGDPTERTWDRDAFGTTQEVDQASMDSFPASDSPPFWARDEVSNLPPLVVPG